MSDQKSNQDDVLDRRDQMTQAKPELAQSYKTFLVSFNKYRKTRVQSPPKTNQVPSPASKPNV